MKMLNQTIGLLSETKAARTESVEDKFGSTVRAANLSNYEEKLELMRKLVKICCRNPSNVIHS